MAAVGLNRAEVSVETTAIALINEKIDENGKCILNETKTNFRSNTLFKDNMKK